MIKSDEYRQGYSDGYNAVIEVIKKVALDYDASAFFWYERMKDDPDDTFCKTWFYRNDAKACALLATLDELEPEFVHFTSDGKICTNPEVR